MADFFEPHGEGSSWYAESVSGSQEVQARFKVGETREVTLPRPPQIRTCSISASGSSYCGLAACVFRWCDPKGGTGVPLGEPSEAFPSHLAPL